MTIAPLPGVAGLTTTAQSTNMSSTPRTSRKRALSALQPTLINDTEDGGSKRRRTERGGKAVKGKAIKDKAVGEKEDDTKFWKKPGMNTFLDWLLNTDNLQRFETTGTTAGTLVKDLRDEIATYINDNSDDRGKDSWKPWTGDNVKYNKTACEAKYRRARDLMKKTGGGDDDTNTLKERVRKICPMFTRFHDVYLRSVRVNPPPMVQTTAIPGEPEPVSTTVTKAATAIAAIVTRATRVANIFRWRDLI